jgi:hypothetical protein
MVGIVGTSAFVAAAWLLWAVLTGPASAATFVLRILE